MAGSGRKWKGRKAERQEGGKAARKEGTKKERKGRKKQEKAVSISKQQKVGRKSSKQNQAAGSDRKRQ